MNSKFSFGKVQLDVSLGTAPAGRRREPDAPFCLAVLGDFTGRANRKIVEPLTGRRVWTVDCDNFEEVFRRLEPKLKLAEVGEIGFADLEDFHPDRLLTRVAPLSSLWKSRADLRNPATASGAAAELRKALPGQKAAGDEQKVQPTESNDQTLERLMGGGSPPSAAPKATSQAGPVAQLLRQAVGSSAVPEASAEQTGLLAWTELELTNRLRAILHEPDFQALEAAWRGLDLLVRSFGGEEEFKLKLVDVSFAELAGDLMANENLAGTGLGKLLQRQQEEQPWAAWVGMYTFENQPHDIELLGRLAKLSAMVGAPFLSGARPNLVGCDSFGSHPDPDDWNNTGAAETTEAWNALRSLSESSYLGLALPRFLLRQPYGKESDPIESFAFEELGGEHRHEDYLWGNPAVICAHVLASAFQAEGWEMSTSGYGELGELPVYRFKEDAETKVKPCAEAWLSERAADAISRKGLMPVLSIKGRDAVRLNTLHSLAGKAFQVG